MKLKAKAVARKPAPPLSLRLTGDDRDRLEELARKDARPVSNLARKFIRDGIERMTAQAA